MRGWVSGENTVTGPDSASLHSHDALTFSTHPHIHFHFSKKSCGVSVENWCAVMCSAWCVMHVTGSRYARGHFMLTFLERGWTGGRVCVETCHCCITAPWWSRGIRTAASNSGCVPIRVTTHPSRLAQHTDFILRAAMNPECISYCSLSDHF